MLASLFCLGFSPFLYSFGFAFCFCWMAIDFSWLVTWWCGQYQREIAVIRETQPAVPHLVVFWGKSQPQKCRQPCRSRGAGEDGQVTMMPPVPQDSCRSHLTKECGKINCNFPLGRLQLGQNDKEMREGRQEKWSLNNFIVPTAWPHN